MATRSNKRRAKKPRPDDVRVIHVEQLDLARWILEFQDGRAALVAQAEELVSAALGNADVVGKRRERQQEEQSE